MIYGGLADLLPHFDATPVLDLILFGPNDYGKLPVRNPQGAAQLGQTLLVCDQGRPDVVAIDMATGQSTSWPDRHHTPRCPVDICTDGQRVFVADTTNRSVVVYGLDGRFERELVGPDDAASTQPSGPPGASPPPLRRSRPTAVRVHDGVLYIADAGHRRVDRYDLGQSGWLDPLRPPPAYPRIAAPTGLDFSADGTLHIVDSLQQRVLRRSAGGEWLPPIGRPGRGAGQFVRPKSVCCTAGLVLVTDAARQSLLVFQSDGAFVTEVHETSSWRGFTLASSMAKLSPDAPPAARITEKGWRPPDELIVVSDAMGVMPLLLVGTFNAERGSQAAAR